MLKPVDDFMVTIFGHSGMWKFLAFESFSPIFSSFTKMNFQGPHILRTVSEIHRNNSHLSLHLKANIKQPWIISIRICSELSPQPSQLKNLRIRKVNENEVILFWNEKFTKSR